MDIQPSTNDIVRDLFVRTADENYITARWCAMNHLNSDFLWLGVHCLEKYMKAALLLNGKSAKGYSHDIVELYGPLKKVAGPLIRDTLEKPDGLSIGRWAGATTPEFLERLLQSGNADNRYLLYGYVTRGADLFMLDQLVFDIRRLACSLDGAVFRSSDVGAAKITNRQLLSQNPLFHPTLHMPLDALIEGKSESPVRFAALNLNFSFAPEDFDHQAIQASGAGRNPVLARRILDPLASDDVTAVTEALAVAEWFLANVQASKDGIIEPIKQAMLEARARLSAA
ncbi:hypothetical protein PQR33_22705 [Paraburkholderia sediminicola]|uniref:hypothetical protein n=1 Tax=Paraburkholderia sediminicola TaxID=458836 RepID=UPI0038B9C07E